MAQSEEAIKTILPKTYRRRLVAREICFTLANFRSLTPMMDKYVYNDGTVKDLMCLSGTVPVKFKGKTYNIPICLWIEETYPQTAPICYVKPTPEMMIVSGKYVTTSGEVLLPYLEEWKHDDCDLVSLLQVMVATFGDFPPVCMRPSSESEQATCWQQSHRQAGMFSNTDGTLYLHLTREDGQPFHQDNESNC